MNRKLFAAVCVLMALGLSFSACKKDKDPVDDPQPDPTPTAYFTFATVGNIAEYETETPVLVQTFTGTMVQEVLSKHGSEVYMIETNLDLGIPGSNPVNSTGYWKITNNQFASVDDDQGSNPFPYFTQGDAVNKTYTITDSAGIVTRTVESLNESVTVPEGTFSCVKVKETNSYSQDESTYYIHKDAGVVKILMEIEIMMVGTINITISMADKNF